MNSRVSTKVLVLFLIGMFTFMPAANAANHTLEWGVEVGEEFTYALQRKVFDSTYTFLLPHYMASLLDLEAGDLFTATVMELATIPEMINDTQQIPASRVTLAKGSETLEQDSTAFVVPIGDWDLLTESLNLTEYPDISLIDTTAEWGISEVSTFTNQQGQSFSYAFEWKYEKANGTLSYTRLALSTLGSSLIDIVVSLWTEGVPTVIPDDLQLSTVLIIAVAGAVGVIVAIIVFRWVKKPKGLAAELGR